MNIEQTVKRAMHDVAELSDCQLIEPIKSDTLLLQSGLDSLGYAMLVAQLEEELGIDPFTELAITVYPATFAEFVAVYAKGLEQQSR